MASGPSSSAARGGARAWAPTGDQIAAINRFPDDNPNPVMRVDGEGRLTYANPASSGALEALGIDVGGVLAEADRERLDAAGRARTYVELFARNRTWAVWPVPIPDMGFTNLYATDVTAERAIVKFPDQNPNPVLRIGPDDSLLYANAASAGLVAGLGLEIGAPLPPELLAPLCREAASEQPRPVEVSSGDRRYALLAVTVPEFGFVNVYGTDVTAERERERLARENERLLLNILPEPIARRLRDGEPLIADRFDDVTLLFADIAEFTRMSSSMSPVDLVTVLNDVFSAFDTLVDRHGLEKVKTIGDAYMVVGGMLDDAPDHTARVAAMAIELAAAIGRIEAAERHGIRFRIGIHCGPIVAGVIGTRKFIYDVWGDTVNMASRMESLGVPGRIQVTHAVRERLADVFAFEARGLIDVKGKGPTPTWFLEARRPAASPHVGDAAAGRTA